MARLTSMLLVIAFTVLAACLEVPPSKPLPTEAQKQALLQANVILAACSASDMEQVKALLEKNPALVNSQNDVGETPLWRAVVALHPNEELVKYLLEHGADVEGSAKWGESPFHGAAARSSKRIVELLLEHGAKVNARMINGRMGDGRMPMSLAASNNQTEVADVLLAHGAEINLFEAAALGKTKRLEEFLRRDPNSINAKDDQGLTPLHWAAMHGHAETVRFLLGHKADRFVPDRWGNSPCAVARARNRAQIVELMHCP